MRFTSTPKVLPVNDTDQALWAVYRALAEAHGEAQALRDLSAILPAAKMQQVHRILRVQFAKHLLVERVSRTVIAQRMTVKFSVSKPTAYRDLEIAVSLSHGQDFGEKNRPYIDDHGHSESADR